VNEENDKHDENTEIKILELIRKLIKLIIEDVL